MELLKDGAKRSYWLIWVLTRIATNAVFLIQWYGEQQWYLRLCLAVHVGLLDLCCLVLRSGMQEEIVVGGLDE